MRALLLRSLILPLAAAMPLAAQGDFTWSKQIPDGGRLTIRSLNGPIEVRASSNNKVTVTATLRAENRGNVGDMTFDVREHGADDIEICTVWQGRSVCDRDRDWSFNNVRVSARFVIELPKSLRFKGITGNGDVTLQQSVAEVDVTTGNGDVMIKESQGPATVTTGNGDITINAAKGMVKASTGNGRVEANTSKGPVTASSGNGDIVISMTTLPADAGSMKFTTGSGNVRVTLPADFNGELDASTGNGSIDSDFEVHLTGRINPQRLRGTVGNGNGPLIRLTSGNGRLVIRKG